MRVDPQFQTQSSYDWLYISLYPNFIHDFFHNKVNAMFPSSTRHRATFDADTPEALPEAFRGPTTSLPAMHRAAVAED